VEAVSEKALQTGLDAIDAGIEVVGVNIKDIHPPIKISDAFEEVIASYQKKMEMINLAHMYQNEEIPASRGKAYDDVSNANAFVQEEVMKSEGAAASLQSKLQPYRSNKSIIRKLLYYDHMVRVLKDRKKVLIDPKVGEPDLYLNFENGLSIPKLKEKDK